MKLSEVKFKDLNGKEDTIQAQTWIIFTNGSGNYVENIEFTSVDLDSFPLDKILQLKKVGFESDEIIKLIKELK